MRLNPLHRRRLGVLVGIALLLPVLGGTAAASPVDDKRAEAARIQQQLAAQGDRVSVLDEQYNRAREKADEAQASLAKTKGELASADARFKGAQGNLTTYAVSSYVHGGDNTFLSELLKSKGSDLVSRRQYLQVAASDQRQAMDELKAAREDLTSAKAKAESDQKSAADAASQVDANRRQAEAAVAQQQQLLTKVNGDLAQLVAQEQAKQDAENARKAQALLASRQTAAATSGGASSGSSSKSKPNVAKVGSAPAPPPGHGAGAAIEEARRQLGKPYQYGAAGPDTFDCSGLVMWSWRAGGVSLSHSTYSQWDETTHVPLSDLQPGDIVFFGSDLHHDGLYIGGGQMIEAPHTGEVVRYASIYRSDLYGAGRVRG